MADTASDGEEEDAVPLTLRDCRPGLWVEVRTPKAHITWRGMISSVDPARKAPVRVKWLGECKGKAWPSDMPNHLFIWKGGEHDIHIESIHNVSDDLFHVARRYRMPTGILPLKEDTGFYCLSYECQGRCSNSVAPNITRCPERSLRRRPKDLKFRRKSSNLRSVSTKRRSLRAVTFGSRISPQIASRATRILLSRTFVAECSATTTGRGSTSRNRDTWGTVIACFV